VCVCMGVRMHTPGTVLLTYNLSHELMNNLRSDNILMSTNSLKDKFV